MKLFKIAKKFSDGFKAGWNECQADGKAICQTEEHNSALDMVQHDFFISEDVSPNDKSHPYHDYYYGKK